MTDEMRLAELRANVAAMRMEALRPGGEETGMELLLRLLSTARSERDAALSRVERLEEIEKAARKLDGVMDVGNRAALHLRASEAANELHRVLSALSPPVESEYPPEQMA